MSVKIKFVSLGIWQWDGACAQGPWEEYREWAQQTNGANPSVFDTGTPPQGHAWVVDGLPWLLWTETADPIVIAHEALHITSGVLKARGLVHTDESEEAYTYTMMAIMREALATKGWAKVGKSGRVR